MIAALVALLLIIIALAVAYVRLPRRYDIN